MRFLIFSAAVLAFSCGAPAHEPEKSGGPAGLEIEVSKEANPWSHLEMRNDPKAFQFAIVADRTGGARPGVFEEAIRKLNLLQPEFVMSVGDMIQGYSTDRRQIDSQWDEFEGLIKKLEMPYFYVPGNHDCSNPEMTKAWKERFGRPYYSFVYHGVLFVCLNSQDPEMHHIGDAQAKWLEDTLAAHKDVRWTLVFLHSPLWEETFSKDRGWERVEKALGDRKYTVFSGHFHSYLKQSRNGHLFYTLATTGGGSGLRGQAHGEFDQIVWVTMTEAGPVVANFLLDAIHDDAVRTPESRELVRLAGSGQMVSIAPVILDSGNPPDTVHMELVLTNPLAIPVELKFSVVPAGGVTVRLVEPLPKSDDGRYSVTLQPQARRAVGLEIKPGTAYSGEALAAATLDCEAKFLTEAKRPITLRSSMQAMIMPRLVLRKPGSPVTVDGDLSEWPSGEMIRVDSADYSIGKKDSWKGPEDASFSWAASADDEFLYVAVDVTDESVQAAKDVPPWKQDGIEVRIDPRPAAVRIGKPDSDADGGGILIAMSPSPSAGAGWVWQPEQLPDGTRAICVRTKSGYRAEAAVPLDALQKINPKWRDDGVRLNVAMDDFDGGQGVQIWWQPDWRTPLNLPGSGVFLPSGG